MRAIAGRRSPGTGTLLVVVAGLAAVPALLVRSDGASEPEATLRVTATEKGGEPVAARLSIFSKKEGFATSAYFRAEIVETLPAGEYRVVVSRGPTHDLVDREVTLEAGKRTDLAAVLTRVVSLPGLLSVDPFFSSTGIADRELARSAEDVDVLLTSEETGSGAVRDPRGSAGRLTEAGLCPFRGIPAAGRNLDGLWGISFGEGGDQDGWWSPYASENAVRFDWFHLLTRGIRVVGLTGSGASPIPGLGRVYVPASSREAVLPALRSGAGSLSWGVVVQVWGQGAEPGRLVAARFGGVELRVRITAPRWVETDEVTIFAGGEPVMRTDLRPFQDTVRLDRTYALRPARDTWYVVAASASSPMTAYRPLEVRPLGIAGPVWVDADGDGRWTPAQSYAAEVIRRGRGSPAAALDALELEPLPVRVQAAATTDDPVLADHLADDLSLAVRLAAAGNLASADRPWARDILVRRLVKCDKEALEQAGIAAALARCGTAAGLERFEVTFGQTALVARDAAWSLLERTAALVHPPRWHVVGPFNDPDRLGVRGRYGPERGMVPGQPFRDMRGAQPVWSQQEPPGGMVTFEAGDAAGIESPEAPAAEAAAVSVVYFALARFTMTHGADIALLYGNRDGIVLWIDGDLAEEQTGREARRLYLERYLARGDHEVRLKVSVRRGATRVPFHVIDPTGAVRF